MTDTEARPEAARHPGSSNGSGVAGGLRPGRAETDRLAARVAVPGEDRETMEVRSPLNGELLGVVPVGTEDDVTAAVERARVVQRAWAATPVKDRAAVLLRYHDLVLEQQDELLDLIQAENGKARVWAFEEILDQAVTARYYARLAPRALKPKTKLTALPGLVRTWEHHVPKGVIGVISPWNYPLGAGRLRCPGRAGRRQRHRDQARQPDPVHRHPGLRAARGGRAARGPGADRHRARAAASARPSSTRPTT